MVQGLSYAPAVIFRQDAAYEYVPGLSVMYLYRKEADTSAFPVCRNPIGMFPDFFRIFLNRLFYPKPLGQTFYCFPVSG